MWIKIGDVIRDLWRNTTAYANGVTDANLVLVCHGYSPQTSARLTPPPGRGGEVQEQIYFKFYELSALRQVLKIYIS